MSESESNKPKSEGGGCFSKLLLLILLAAAVGLGAAIYYAIIPQEGYDATAKKLPERDISVVLKNSIDRGYAVTLSEEEINQWLGRVLVAKQDGLLAEQVKFDRVWVRLEEGVAEVVMQRSLLGKPFTVSMFVQVERVESADGVGTNILLHGGPYHADLLRPPRGGRFGHLVVPQGFLILVMPAYEKLAALFTEEIDLAFSQMARIRLEDDKLVLDPREPLGAGGLPESF